MRAPEGSHPHLPAGDRDREAGLHDLGLHLRPERRRAHPRLEHGPAALDAFLNAYNPSGMSRRPVFWGPGRHQFAQEWS